MTTTETTQPAPPGELAPRPRRRRRRVLGAAVVLAVVALLAFTLGQRYAGPPEPGGADGATDEVGAGAAAEEPRGDSGPPLTWAPPELEDPETIQITEDDATLQLEPDQDYELVLPDEPLVREGGVTVYGGRNVVLIGGEIVVPQGDDEGNGLRALFLRDQTGTVHVEGVKLSGEGLGEGINLDQREGAVVQLQNIWVGEVFGVLEGHHGDLVQLWAGPAELRVDGLTGSTGYQGLFLLPKQFGEQPEPERFDLRRVDISGAEDGNGYLLWRDDLDWPLVTTDVWVAPTDADPEDRGSFLWDREGEDSWADVKVGTPPGGSFVPEDRAGVGYSSPGYRDQE